jgi:hypothetical protein
MYGKWADYVANLVSLLLSVTFTVIDKRTSLLVVSPRTNLIKNISRTILVPSRHFIPSLTFAVKTERYTTAGGAQTGNDFNCPY